MKKENRIRKLIELLQEAQKHGGVSIMELARELKVTERTVYADLNVIESKMNLPLQRPKRKLKDHEGKYLLTIKDDESELIPLYSMILEKKLWPSRLHEWGESYLSENVGSFNDDLILNFQDLRYKIQIKDFELVNLNQSKDNLKIFLQSLADNHEIEITYTSFYRNNEVTRRVVRPYGLLWFNANWYAIAFCLLRDNLRTFKLDRVINAKLLKTNFIRPKDFNLDTYFSDSWGIVVEHNKPLEEVKLLFSPKVASEVIKYKYHSSQQNRWIDNGWLEISFKISAISEMKNWVLSWGSEVLVVEPEDLRQELIQQLKSSLQNLGVNISEEA